MQTLTKQDSSTNLENTSSIHKFREFFWVDQNINEDIIAKQKEIFWFSLFLLHSKSIYEALKIWFLNSRSVFESTKSILSIPHTYIFWWLALGFLLQLINAIYLFLPIFFMIVFFSIFPILRIIQQKVKLYKESRIFFNIDATQAENIKTEFLELVPFTPKEIIWKNKWWGTTNGNSTGGKLFFYLFSQPFIFGHLHLFAGIPNADLIIFDIALFLILFWVFEKWIFYWFVLYYSLYFYLFDKFPWFFSREDQERDFYMDLYESGNVLLNSLDRLEKDMTDAKNCIIQPTLGKNLTSTIQKIEELYYLIEKNNHLLEWKDIFQKFLISMLNEILTIYSYVFDFLTDHIHSIENNIDINGLDEVQRWYLLQIIKPILDNKKIQLQNMKEVLLSKRI